MNRRSFLHSSTGATAGMLAAGTVGKAQPNERIQVGIMGAGGRALSLISTFASNPSVEVVAIADIDPRRFPRAVQEVMRRQNRQPQTVADFVG